VLGRALSSRPRRIGLAVATCAALGTSAVASAHIGHTITRAERYLKLDATEADTRFVVSLTLGEDEGARVLSDVDTDGDGTVTPAESSVYLDTWASGLREELPIEIDGAPVEVTWTDGWLDPLGEVRRVPVTVEMVAHLPVDGREHRIAVRDAMVRREVFDRTDVSFRAHDGAELVVSGAVEDPMAIEEDLGFVRGDAPLERLVAVVRYPARTGVALRAAAVLAGSTLATALLAFLATRRRG
jgi:hypothetical protein